MDPEVLHDKRESSVAKQVGVANEKELDRELHRFPELKLVDCSCPDEIAFCADIDGLIGLANAVIDPSGVENVYLCDFDLLVDLLFFELGVLRLIQGSGLFPRGIEIEALEQVGKIGAGGLRCRKARQASRTW